MARYQRLFREFITSWITDTAESAPLHAEVMAAAVVASHNHVLRRWFRGESSDPVRELDAAMQRVIDLFTSPAFRTDAGIGTTIAVFRTGQDIDSLLPALRSLAGTPAE